MTFATEATQNFEAVQLVLQTHVAVTSHAVTQSGQNPLVHSILAASTLKPTDENRK